MLPMPLKQTVLVSDDSKQSELIEMTAVEELNIHFQQSATELTESATILSS
jgi:hypothetical protein